MIIGEKGGKGENEVEEELEEEVEKEGEEEEVEEEGGEEEEEGEEEGVVDGGWGDNEESMEEKTRERSFTEESSFAGEHSLASYFPSAPLDSEQLTTHVFSYRRCSSKEHSLGTFLGLIASSSTIKASKYVDDSSSVKERSSGMFSKENSEGDPKRLDGGKSNSIW